MPKHVQHEFEWATNPEPAMPAEPTHRDDPPPTLPPPAAARETCGLRHPGDTDDWETLSMPLPTALPEAVARAVFGVDEHGNVNPAAEEVAEITEHHTERLVDFLNRMQAIDERLARAAGDSRKALYREKDVILSAYQGALALYAEDFGQDASRHLDAWARHQIDSESEEQAAEPPTSRSHRDERAHSARHRRTDKQPSGKKTKASRKAGSQPP